MAGWRYLVPTDPVVFDKYNEKVFVWRLNLMGEWVSWPCLARGLDGMRRRDEVVW